MIEGWPDVGVVDGSREASSRWAADSLCAEIDVATKLWVPRRRAFLALFFEAMAEGRVDALEEVRLAFFREFQARPVRGGPDLMSQCCDDLGQVVFSC